MAVNQATVFFRDAIGHECREQTLQANGSVNY